MNDQHCDIARRRGGGGGCRRCMAAKQERALRCVSVRPMDGNGRFTPLHTLISTPEPRRGWPAGS
eukprot:591878-Hanusia_phi.AAC.2